LNNFYEPAKLDGGDIEVEGNYHRYLNDLKHVIIRVSQNASPAELARVAMAARGSGHYVSVDPGFLAANSLKQEEVWFMVGEESGRLLRFETEYDFDGQRPLFDANGKVVGKKAIKPGTRLILVGAKEPIIGKLQANPDLFVIDTPITKSGRATLLAFYREQSISITQHRFGAIQEELVNILNESKVKA
jgi:hypothetical protein